VGVPPPLEGEEIKRRGRIKKGVFFLLFFLLVGTEKNHKIID